MKNSKWKMLLTAMSMVTVLAGCGRGAGEDTPVSAPDVSSESSVVSGTDSEPIETTDAEQEVETEESTTEPVVEFVEPAAEDFTYLYDESLEGIVIRRYTGRASEIQIPAEIDGVPVKGIGGKTDFAFSSEGTFLFATKIMIPDSVTWIGDAAFSSCGNLTEITIPDSVTWIGDFAFSYCANLTEITIPDSVASIENHAFEGCRSLTEITIPDSVTSIGEYAFSSCEILTEITIPDSVTSIGEFAFSYCHSLTEITIPDSVTEIGTGIFKDCKRQLKVTYRGQEYTSENDTFGWW